MFGQQSGTEQHSSRQEGPRLTPLYEGVFTNKVQPVYQRGINNVNTIVPALLESLDRVQAVPQGPEVGALAVQREMRTYDRAVERIGSSLVNQAGYTDAA